MDAETRAAQLENTLRALLDNAIWHPDADYYGIDGDVLDEARALLDGDSAPAEEP